MHTFFVNTSKKELNYYTLLFDIPRENLKLISYDCPLAGWHSDGEGYLACAKKMGCVIDENPEITNEFNLIVYIDLCEVFQYTSIPKSECRKKAVMLQSLRMLYLHIIQETFVKTLTSNGRCPANTLVMFGEDGAVDSTAAEDRGEGFRGDVVRTMMGFLGLPTDWAAIEDMAAPVCDGDAENKVDLFKQQIAAYRSPYELTGAKEAYGELLEAWYSDLIQYAHTQRACDNLIDGIERCYKAENRYGGVQWVSCPLNQVASAGNKSAYALVQLSIACYLAECVYSEMVVDANGTPRRFILCDAAVLARLLDQKKKTYAAKVSEMETLSQAYSSMNLAPELMAFGHERFGLDEHGDRIFTYTAAEEKASKTEDEQEAGDSETVVKTESEGERLSADEFEPFAYTGEKIDSGVNPVGKQPNDFRAAATRLKEHHAAYLARLREHTKKVLANYACDSVGNHRAVLRKRVVSVGDSDYTDTARDCKYARVDRAAETKSVEVVEDTSRRAYDSIVMRYLEFCAARSVAVTSIDEQYAWINKRIDEIEASIKKMKVAAAGVFAALLLLYIPFLVIQWESIFLNAVTPVFALVSLAAPLAVLGVVYLALAAYQRSQYYKAWQKFKEQSDAVLADNAQAARLYDRLLAEIIPALRWIYEYRLDVNFYTDCCRFAKAKTEHHLAKLRERVTVIGNMIEDLEVGSLPPYTATGAAGERIDLNLSYCTGESNIRYYTILDENLLERMRDGGEL